jgi:hypothetical protein
VHLVFGPLVQKLLNINSIIENSMKKNKLLGKLGHAFDIVEKAINDQ